MTRMTESKTSNVYSMMFSSRVITSFYCIFGIIGLGEFILVLIDSSQPPDGVPDEAAINAISIILTITQLATAVLGGTGIKNKSKIWSLLTRGITLVSLVITI